MDNQCRESEIYGSCCHKTCFHRVSIANASTDYEGQSPKRCEIEINLTNYLVPLVDKIGEISNQGGFGQVEIYD